MRKSLSPHTQRNSGEGCRGDKALGRGKAVGAPRALTLTLHDSCHVLIALSDKITDVQDACRKGDKKKKGWRKRQRKWRRNVSSGDIRHSVDTLVITDEMNNLWASLWSFFMEADASCVISALPLETSWLRVKYIYRTACSFCQIFFLIPNGIASPLTFAYLRNKDIPLSPRIYSSWDKKTRLDQCEGFTMPCWLWVALDVCDVGAVMGS